MMGLEAARLLIEKGTEVNARDKSGNSARTAAGSNNVGRQLIAISQVNNVDEGVSRRCSTLGNGDRSTAGSDRFNHGAQVNEKRRLL